MAGSKTEHELETPAGHYTFVAPSPGRRVIMITLMFTVLGLIYVTWRITDGADDKVFVSALVALAVVAVVQWVLLQTFIPQRIDIDKSVITINRNGRLQRYDLVDPGLEVRVRDGEIAFAKYMEPWSVVRAKDVKWHVFIDVLMHYQTRADVNADLRDQRFRR
jgi:hypothetical protein